MPSSVVGRSILSGALAAALLAGAWQVHLLLRERRLGRIAETHEVELRRLGDVVLAVESFHRDRAQLDSLVELVNAVRANDVDPSALVGAVRAATDAYVSVERVLFERGVVTLEVDARSPEAAARFAERLLASTRLERVVAERSGRAATSNRYLIRATWSAEP